MFGFFTFYRGAVISAEVFYRTAELPRVTGSNLDPKSIGIRPNAFPKKKIRSVPPAGLGG